MHPRIAAVALLGVLAIGCGTSRTSRGATDGGPSGTDVVGAWYGSGPAFPDGALCFLFCDNARFFAGDRPCTDTTAGDFVGGYYTYTVSGTTIDIRDTTRTTMMVTAMVTGDAATFSFDTYTLRMLRTAPWSPLCTDMTIPPR